MSENLSVAVEAIVNEKGGVGKTTLAVQRALNRCLKSDKTLFIDLDPQGNSSSRLLGRDEDGELDYSGTPAYMLFKPLKGFEPTVGWNPNLHVVYARNSDPYLEEVMTKRGKELIEVFAKNLQLIIKAGGYNHVVIDCPPSKTILQRAAIYAATHMYVPSDTTFMEESVQGVLKTWQGVGKDLGSKPKFGGVIANMVNTRSPKEKQEISDIQELLGDRMIGVHIPVLAPIKEITKLGEYIGAPTKPSGSTRSAAKILESLFDEFDKRSEIVA